MKIAVNTRFLLKDKLEGIGTFTHESLRLMVRQHPEHQFYFFFDRPFHDDFVYEANVEPLALFPPARHPFLWYWWFEKSVPKALKKVQADVFLSTDGYASLKTEVLQTLVVHDLAFEHYPKDLDWLKSKYYRHYTPRFINRARRVVTVSEFSKQDIVERYGTDPKKIDVVYNGCKASLGVLTADEKEATRKEFTKGAPYFLFVGALHPRKNIANLFKAFDQMKKQTGLPAKLVIAGRSGWGTDEIEATFKAMEYQEDVVFTGRVSDKNLHRLLGSATALTYVPYLEGFGIPILEAQQCHTPVITSDRTSMPEAAGEGALLVDPFNVGQLAKALETLATDPQEAERLMGEGKKNLERFSWQKTADLLWESIEKTLK